MTDFLLRHAWPLLVSVTLKSLFVLALAGAVLLALRRASAATRNLVWHLSLIGLLLLPYLSAMPLLATWQIPLAPRALLISHDAPVITPDSRPPITGGTGEEAPSAPNSGGTRGKSLALSLRKGGVGGGSQGYSFPWPAWACLLWLIGFALTLLPTLIGLIGVRSLARRSISLKDSPLSELTTALAQEFGVTQSVRLMTGEAGTPMTWGWIRPVILLPIGASEWPPDRLRAVLLHELAHIARMDWPAQMVSHMACALYWFNPLVWLVARQARLEGERACDDRVLLTGISAPDYARHLLDVARSLRDTPLPTALPLVNAVSLKARLQIILDTSRKRGEVGKWLRLVLLETMVMSAWFSYLVAFAVPLPPNRNVRLDAQSYQIISQANAATAALLSLKARIHVTETSLRPWSKERLDGTIIFQRPNFARVNIVGYETFTSDGSLQRFTDSAGKTDSRASTSVAWNGGNIVGPGDSQPFVQYFFLPDYHRLGPVYGTDIFNPFLLTHESPIPVVGRYLGVQTWQGAQCQVVEFTRDMFPPHPDARAFTSVYVGPDHLVHRIVNRLYSKYGVLTDDVWLTNIQTNQLLPRAAFQLPVQGHSET